MDDWYFLNFYELKKNSLNYQFLDMLIFNEKKYRKEFKAKLFKRLCILAIYAILLVAMTHGIFLLIAFLKLLYSYNSYEHSVNSLFKNIYSIPIEHHIFFSILVYIGWFIYLNYRDSENCFYGNKNYLTSLIEYKIDVEKKINEKIIHRDKIIKLMQHYDNEIENSNKIEPSYIKKLRGIKFEKFLKECFQILGFIVSETPKTGDYGVDLIIQKDNSRIAIQVKGIESTVGVKAIQEVHSGKSLPMYECNDAWVITNSFFSENAIKLANHLQVKLIDWKRLLQILPSTHLIPDPDLVNNKHKAERELSIVNKEKINLENQHLQYQKLIKEYFIDIPDN